MDGKDYILFVASSEGDTPDRAGIVAAGYAAASWARARRATWTNAPLAAPPPGPRLPRPPVERLESPAPSVDDLVIPIAAAPLGPPPPRESRPAEIALPGLFEEPEA